MKSKKYHTCLMRYKYRLGLFFLNAVCSFMCDGNGNTTFVNQYLQMLVCSEDDSMREDEDISPKKESKRFMWNHGSM